MVWKSMHNARFTRWSLKLYGPSLAVCVGKPVYREIEGDDFNANECLEKDFLVVSCCMLS
jgi:hypothetical protein